MAVNDNFDKMPPKSGTTGVPPRLVTGRGTQGPKIGTSRQKRDGWQPYLRYIKCAIAVLLYMLRWLRATVREGTFRPVHRLAVGYVARLVRSVRRSQASRRLSHMSAIAQMAARIVTQVECKRHAHTRMRLHY